MPQATPSTTRLSQLRHGRRRLHLRRTCALIFENRRSCGSVRGSDLGRTSSARSLQCNRVETGGRSGANTKTRNLVANGQQNVRTSD